MTRLFFYSLWLTLPLVACSGGKSPYDTLPAGDSGQNTSELQTINEAQNSTRSAVQAAFSATAASALNVTPPPEEKIQKIAGLIKAGNCVQTLVPPAERFDQNWSAQWEVRDQASASTCPIYLYEASSFDNASDRWLLNRTWAMKSATLKSINGMDSLSVRGNMTATSVGLQRKISGQIHYAPFTIAGVGPVAADVVLAATYTGLTGGGQLTLHLATPNNTTTASIYWQGAGLNPIFSLNGAQMDQKSFEALFSSFQLTEIMDRSLKMR